MLKKVMWVLLALVVVVAIFIWRIVANLDGIVADLIRDAGSRALHTEVTVTGVDIKLTEGSATIEGLRIANPAGWSQAPIFDLERISAAIQITSLGQPVIVLQHVDVGHSSVSYEMRADGSNNMQDLLSGIESSAEPSAPPDESAGELRVKIKRLTFDGMDVSVQAESPSDSGSTELKQSQFSLPSLEMQNVGGSEGGTPQELGVAIGKKMAGEILQAAAREGVNQLIEREKNKLIERLLDKVKKN